MKRKVLTTAAVIVTVMVLLTVLTSCLAFPGASAYDIAVRNGFSGTESEWLASLKGDDGEYAGRGDSAYEIAVKNGFSGTEAEWLASLKGTDGTDGAYAGRGDSAYETAVKNGFSGTETEWLASLKGTSSSGESVASATSKAITSSVAVIASYKYTEIGWGGRKTEKIGGGAGSGVIIKDTGSEIYIITNYHVVYGEKAETSNKIAETIWVYFHGALYPSAWEYAYQSP